MRTVLPAKDSILAVSRNRAAKGTEDRIAACANRFTLPHPSYLHVRPLTRFEASAPFHSTVRATHRVRNLVLCALLLCIASVGAALDPPELQRRLATRFGGERVDVLDEWLRLLDILPGEQESMALRKVNDFVNRNVVFADDTEVWKQSDYWATPLETIGQGRGDCEDFSIFKYASLRLVGVSENKLRLVYVKARLRTPGGEIEQAHMVVAYYATPDHEPLVLDNLDPEIKTASKRPDLEPVFSFNGEGVFTGASARSGTPRSQDRLSRWEDIVRRMRAEGFE